MKNRSTIVFWISVLPGKRALLRFIFTCGLRCCADVSFGRRLRKACQQCTQYKMSTAEDETP